MNILFVMNTPFPYGHAFSSRARSFVKMFVSLNYKVHIICPYGPENDGKQNFYCENVFINYIYIRHKKLGLCGVGSSLPYLKAIKRVINNEKIDLIFTNDVVFIFNDILKISKKNNIPYIIEQCEWYDPSMFKFGSLNPYYREHIKMLKKKCKQVDGVIAISSFLENHYKSLNLKTIRVPSIIDCQEYEFNHKSNLDTTISFVGSIGKGKEKFLPIFDALYRINNKKRVILNIYGPSLKSILNNEKIDEQQFEKYKKYVNVEGRVKQELVKSIIQKSDYTIFVRPRRRSSNAGFPTKLAESLAAGTPVITNDTSDIKMLISDSLDSYVVPNGTSDELYAVFQKIISKKANEIDEMRNHARNTAVTVFDYRNYTMLVKDFFKSVYENKKNDKK